MISGYICPGLGLLSIDKGDCWSDSRWFFSQLKEIFAKWVWLLYWRKDQADVCGLFRLPNGNGYKPHKEMRRKKTCHTNWLQFCFRYLSARGYKQISIPMDLLQLEFVNAVVMCSIISYLCKMYCKIYL